MDPFTNPWNDLGQRWGHSWHAMCSYLGAFPPALARSMVALFTDEGDTVLDPFSGRGTTLLEARLLRRKPLAGDLNPIAVAITRAKNVSPTLNEILERVQALRDTYDRVLHFAEAHVQPDQIQLIFHPATLAQLCYLRAEIVGSANPVDQFLVGALLGIMHGSERQDGSSAYLSISMPNTFSMSPQYVRRFVATNRLNRIPRDVFATLQEKANRLYRDDPPPYESGLVLAADAKELSCAQALATAKGKVKLIVTSPPYLDVVNYSKQNWIRQWLLAESPDAHLAGSLADNLSLGEWLTFMTEATRDLKNFLASEGILVFVIGDVAKPKRGQISLARALIQHLDHQRLFSYIGCFSDYIGQEVKTTRIWNDTRGSATEMDRLIVLSDDVPRMRLEGLAEALAMPDLKTRFAELLTPEQLEMTARRFSAAA